MKKILRYNRFIKEATLSGDKQMPYSLSRRGKSVAMKKLVNEIETSNINNFDIKLDLSKGDIPGDDEKVIWIRNSTVTEINFSALKLKLEVESNDDLMIYHTDSDDINIDWAVAKRGSISNMVRQYDRVGPSKRGNHFRETAFLITLAIRAWLNAGVKLNIHTHHGKILMRYETRKGIRFASISNNKSMEDINNSYDMFTTGKKIMEGMENQCDFLLGYDKSGNRIKDGYLSEDDISNISYIVKNSKDLLINKFAQFIFKEEIQNKKRIILDAGELLGDYNFYDIPELSNMAKWNPSDFWIVFKGNESLSNYNSYDDMDNIDDLNDFLGESVIHRKGLVGVSLKQTINTPKLMIVNSGNKDIDNKLKADNLDKVVKPSRKTANIDFSWKFENEPDVANNWKDGSGIDCRTFDSNQTSNISLELKSKGGYVSGKAGSMINHLMPDNLYQIKEFIRKKKDKSEIREYLVGEMFVVENDYLSGIFNQDLSGEGEKSNAENSRLQSIVFIDWLYNLPQEIRDDYITKIVDFAKSESIWSAPHLVVK
jgi:hypothetical protein